MPQRAPTHSELLGRKHRDVAYRQQGKGLKAQAIYKSSTWQHLRALVLREQPWCADPERWHRDAGRHARAEQVDHIVPLHQAMELAYVRSNLQGLCTRCHNRKTRRGS